MAASNDKYFCKKDLSVVHPVFFYTYEQMLLELNALAEKHPDRLMISTIGRSEEGRDLVLAVMGNQKAEKKILIHASIHAREYITAAIVMAQIDYMLTHKNTMYGDMTIGELLDCTCLSIVPMVNPDGVNIVQSGRLPEMFKAMYSADIATLWKANAKGVDLNANFDAGWESYGDNSTDTPAPYGYKGSSPECAAESRALADYMRRENFDLTLSYHTSGSVIYYSFGENGKVNRLGLCLAERIYRVSGYTPEEQSKTSTAGFKDWAIEKCSVPSLTVEFGTGESPIKTEEFSSIWKRCRDILVISAEWVHSLNQC